MTDLQLEKRRLSLSGQVMLGLVLGVAVGIFFGEMVSWLKYVGDVFIKLLQITVIPYISLSLVTGLGELSFDEVKRLALRGGSLLLLLWAITLAIVVLMPLSFPLWPSASFFSTSLIEEPVTPDFLLLFIPSNPFYSYANALVPAIVLFSILVGIALIGLPKKQAILEPLEVFREVLMWITGMVAKLAPLGVFALMAYAAGTTDISDLARLQVYIVLYALISIVLGLWVLPGLITVLTPLRYGDIIRALRTPLVTAFATGSSLIVLPMLIQQCKQLIADAPIFGEQAQEEADASVKVLIPSFYTFPSPGVLMALSFILFAGWYIGSEVSVANYLALIFVGLPSLFGGTLLAVPFLLDLLKLPYDLFQVFVAIDVVNTRFGTLLAVMHYAVIGVIGSIAAVGRLRLPWIPLLRYVLISSALIAAVLLGVRAFYTHVVVAPYTKAEALKSLHFLDSPQPATVYGEMPPGFEKVNGKLASLSTIRERGIVRVCYQPEEYPSAFYNNAEPPQLVGFDIEMAHRFAQKLNLSIEFIPARDEQVAAERLNAGACDIYMRTLPITAQKTKNFGLTSPVYTSSLGVIVRDHRREEFQQWDQFRTRGASLRLGIEDTPENLMQIQFNYPQATVVPIADMEEQRRILESGGEDVDAIIDMAEEAAAWTVLYPYFSLVVPQPTKFFPVAYAVARDNDRLLTALNAWLLAEKSSGTIDTLYNHWMLGEAAKTESPPRWSVIRDVLGWVD